MKDKHEFLISIYDKKLIVYIIKINHNLYKFGASDNIRQINISEDHELIYCIESKNNILLEQKFKDYLKTTSYYNSNNTEIIDIKSIKCIEGIEVIEGIEEVTEVISIIKTKLIELNQELEKNLPNYELKIKDLNSELKKYKELVIYILKLNNTKNL